MLNFFTTVEILIVVGYGGALLYAILQLVVRHLAGVDILRGEIRQLKVQIEKLKRGKRK